MLNMGVLLFRCAVIGIFFLELSSTNATADNFKEGVDYQVLNEIVETDKGKVIEFFSYYCPYCYRTQPGIKLFIQNMPEGTKFERIAVTLGKKAGFEPTAYISFIAKDLGMEAELHDYIYAVIHAPLKTELKSYQQFNTMAHIEDLFLDNGVDQKTFVKALQHAESENGVSKADERASRYQVSGTPALIVNGRYLAYPKLEGPGAASETAELLMYLLKK